MFEVVTKWMGDCYMIGFVPWDFPRVKCCTDYSNPLDKTMCIHRQKDHLHTLKVLSSMLEFGGVCKRQNNPGCTQNVEVGHYTEEFHPTQKEGLI